ncbi:MAG: GGDEF domain-containing protein, partial [Bryobacteraceae bacterium]
DDYLTKPFDNNELRVRLGPARRILELQSALLATQSALHEQATRDSLTGLWNRRAILEMLDRELSRAMRDHDSLGVVLGDLDHFKSINDCYGHIAGDTTLREVAGQLQSCVRHYDAVGRYGGEEFLIVLPGCDMASSEQTAARMRAGVQRIPASLFGVGREITVSFGVTSLEAGASRKPDLESMIRTADQAMYRAKEQGRNRVVTLPMLRSVE